MTKTVDVSEILKPFGGMLDDTVEISEILGKPITIVDIEFIETVKYGVIAIITLDDGTRVRVFSQVLIEQLKQLKPHVDKGIKVRGKIVKQKRYYTFVSAKGK